MSKSPVAFHFSSVHGFSDITSIQSLGLHTAILGVRVCVVFVISSKLCVCVCVRGVYVYMCRYVVCMCLCMYVDILYGWVVHIVRKLHTMRHVST